MESEYILYEKYTNIILLYRLMLNYISIKFIITYVNINFDKRFNKLISKKIIMGGVCNLNNNYTDSSNLTLLSDSNAINNF